MLTLPVDTWALCGATSPTTPFLGTRPTTCCLSVQTVLDQKIASLIVRENSTSELGPISVVNSTCL